MDVFNYELVIYPSGDPGKARRLGGINTDFALQTIPMAAVFAPSGKAIRRSGGGSDSDAKLPEEWLDPTKLLTVAFRRVRRARGAFSAGRRETYVLFEGYPVTPSASLTKKSAEGNLVLVHWMSSLTSSNILNSYAFAPDLSDFGIPILYKEVAATVGVQPEVGGQVSGYATRLGLPNDYVTRIAEDAWAFGFKAMMATLATFPVQQRLADIMPCEDLLNVINPNVQEALSRFEGPSPALSKAYKDAGPLVIRQSYNGVQFPELVTAVRKLVVDFPNWKQNMTFWAKLQQMSSSLMLGVIPRPTDALVVPMVSVPNRTYDLEIEPWDIISVSWSETDDIRVRGMIVVGTQYSETGVKLRWSPDNRPESLGCYVGSDDPKQGLIAVTRVPDWIERLSLYYRGMAVVNRFRIDKPHAAQTDTTDPKAAQMANDVDMSGANVAQKSIFSLYAKTRWVDEEVRNNRATIVVPLRMDVCPGSFVKVNLGDFAKQLPFGEDTKYIVGRVVRVRLSLDRQNRQDVAVLELASVLPDDRYESGELTLDDHPVFEDVFIGAKLGDPIEEVAVSPPNDKVEEV
ncbi:MAG: hypothetical protein KatS3mg109_0019 [Pirellulaceae bacterium]|nr:MAG: hypothetical protein KatS3mg109_0019 [Pirellulaceae bacterium]